ncbi:hypothetical protein BDD21_4717 [Thiocapsa rosea]|uniref:Uncharacterized protein n=1 Tax=Thiocapsa rosea TaxID=69360 RepID=A0A495VH11_9GAMM|nr:hypothetical protein BDD21_4717 [Thiocapsa rosea]
MNLIVKESRSVPAITAHRSSSASFTRRRRPSLAFNNTHEEIDTLVRALRQLSRLTLSIRGR